MTRETKKSQFSILFVDDEEKARKYFEKGLKNHFSVLTAQSVDDAKTILKEKADEIAVVISDQRMPGGNGVKLLSFLKKNHPQIIRLLTTAYSDLSDAIDSVNKGEIFRYIQKPWDFDLLRTELSQAVEFFEVKRDREILLREKVMVKKKMAKIDRLRLLILITKTLENFRNSYDSVENFVREFSHRNLDNNNQHDDWQSFELGNHDLLEILFSINMMDKVRNKIANTQDCALNFKLNDDSLRELLLDEAGDNAKIDMVCDVKDIEINENIFRFIIKTIFSLVEDHDVRITENNGVSGIVIKFHSLKDEIINQHNIFNISARGSDSDICTDLLISYLFAGHHGGTIKINDDQSITLTLPFDTGKTIVNDNFSEDSIDNMLLSVMLD